jgi:predicted homoserine dehydrogenase-like protein
VTLHAALLERARAGRPVRVALIGAGTFGCMFLAQARRTPGIEVTAIVDRDPQAAARRIEGAGWPPGELAVTDDAARALEATDVVIEATGDPAAGLRHALAAIDAGRHVVMVNVEADVLAGPMLASRAAAAGVVYSLAYGDQPALICELVDWARTAGFEVIAAGKGTRHLPGFHASTPDTVWEHYGIDADHARDAGFNPRMFNSFLDGTKSAIEMAAVANATGLLPPPGGLAFPPAGQDDLAEVLRPRADGGVLEVTPAVEVVSSLYPDGAPVPRDLRWGVFVVFRAADQYVAQRFADYGVRTDATGRYAALYRPSHLIGLELGISVASVALRGEPTGAPTRFAADVVAVAKRDLVVGETLDGEGGWTVYGRLTAVSPERRGLPIGLAHGTTLRAPVAAGEIVRWEDVEINERRDDVIARREMEEQT